MSFKIYRMTVDDFKVKVFVLKDKLFRFSKSILFDEVEAQDVTQDVLMKLWEMRNELHAYNNIEALAMTTTRNLSLDRARKKNRTYQKTEVLKYQMNIIEHGNPTENNELGEVIRGAIANLKEPQRTIMHLRDVEQLSFEEMEPIVKMNIETLRVNLSRARKKVREEIKNIMNYGIA